MNPIKIKETIEKAQQKGVSRLEAQLLMLFILERKTHDRSWLLAHDDEFLSLDKQILFNQAIQARLGGKPIAYITGEKEFFGLTLKINHDVLDPRADTETLVDWALEILNFNHHLNINLNNSDQNSNSNNINDNLNKNKNKNNHLTILDLGTGSGAIALAIQNQINLIKNKNDLNKIDSNQLDLNQTKNFQVFASDLSLNALNIAQKNAHILNLPVRFFHGDWFHALEKEVFLSNNDLNQNNKLNNKLNNNQKNNKENEKYNYNNYFDLIISNPPYIQKDDEHLADLKHEPISALISEENGLSDLHHIIKNAPTYLKDNAYLLLEHGWNQAENVRDLLNKYGFVDIQTRKDLANIERCSGGRWTNTKVKD